MDDDPALRQLAIAVVKRAVTDLKGGDPVAALDAALWLTGKEAPLWMDALDMPFADCVIFVTSGRARKLKKRSFEHG